jgi:acyl-CoA hydrolase
MDFLSPVYVGDLLFAKASVNFISRTSMEVGVRVEVECLRTGAHYHVGSAYLTFVALDSKGKPTEIPQLNLENEQEQRRFEEAKKRREDRLKEVREHPRRNKPCLDRSEKSI